MSDGRRRPPWRLGDWEQQGVDHAAVCAPNALYLSGRRWTRTYQSDQGWRCVIFGPWVGPIRYESPPDRAMRHVREAMSEVDRRGGQSDG